MYVDRMSSLEKFSMSFVALGILNYVSVGLGLAPVFLNFSSSAQENAFFLLVGTNIVQFIFIS